MKKTSKNGKTMNLKWFGWASGYNNHRKVKRELFWNSIDKPSIK